MKAEIGGLASSNRWEDKLMNTMRKNFVEHYDVYCRDHKLIDIKLLGVGYMSPGMDELRLETKKDVKCAYLCAESDAAGIGEIVDTPQSDQEPGTISPESASARKFGLYTKEPRWCGGMGRS